MARLVHVQGMDATRMGQAGAAVVRGRVGLWLDTRRRHDRRQIRTTAVGTYASLTEAGRRDGPSAPREPSGPLPPYAHLVSMLSSSSSSLLSCSMWLMVT